MKNLFISLSLLLTLAVSSCKNDEPNKVANIEVGTNNADTLYVNRDQKIFFLLKGGDNKYKANTEDAKIATAEINKDSLFITGHFNGGTPLTIHSHDLQRRLFIKVVPPPFDATEKVVTLAPGDDARTLNLAGGGPKATLTQEGPEKKVTFDGNAKDLKINLQLETALKDVNAASFTGNFAELKVKNIAGSQVLLGSGNDVVDIDDTAAEQTINGGAGTDLISSQ